MQCACYEKGKFFSHFSLSIVGFCNGGNNFGELFIMKGLNLSDGSVLLDGRITPFWMQFLFWRSFLVMFLHYVCILLTGSLALKLGIFEQRYIDTQIAEEVDRPSEDNATIFAFVKQVFYHKTLAYTKFEKNKRLGIYAKGCCARKREIE